MAAWALAGLLLSGLATARAGDNPLAPAEQGKIACYKPNPARKTCWELITFTRREDGGYEAAIRARFSNTTDYESRSKVIVTLQDGKLCNTLGQAQFDEARFFHLGDEVIKQDLADLRAQIIEQVKSKFGTVYCDSYGTADDQGLIPVTSTENGVAQPPGSAIASMMWINPEDGYKLRPSSE